MCDLLCGVANVLLMVCVFECGCLEMSLYFVRALLYGDVWCVCYSCFVLVCDMVKRACVFSLVVYCMMLHGLFLCGVVCVVFMCLRGLCVIECAMLYGLLLLIACACVDF